MRLICRPDWEDAAERLTRWWAGESLGRPAMSLTAPSDGATSVDLPQPPSLWDRWTNPDYVVPRVDATIHSTAYFAEACPMEWVNLGAVSQVGYLGTKVVCAPSTVWHEPFVEEWTGYHPEVDRENEWYRITKRLTERMMDAADGKWFVGNGEMPEVGDVMSAIRGPQEFCMDLIEGPRGEMERVRDEIRAMMSGVYDEALGMLPAHWEGTSGWLRIWHPGRTTTSQCDFSCMISKDMFDDFLAPALKRQTARVDGAMYHLDGEGALQHVDTLLELPNLRGIQWVPGDGSDPCYHPRWRPLLRKIIEAGKCVHLSVPASEIERLVTDLPPEGLYLVTGCASESDARELLASVARWSIQRR